MQESNRSIGATNRRAPAAIFACSAVAAAVLVLAGLVSGATANAQSTQYGLEWPGNGSVRRMLYWHNPFPIYDATYVFKVYPRKKTGQHAYYTTFFWGNDGTFIWNNGSANTYYGAHPYPAGGGPGQWEISVASNDYVTGTEVDWDRWHTQAFRAWRESATVTHHEFYYDLPDTSKVIKTTIVSSNWAKQNPPTPAIVMGQAPNLNGVSWGGYAGWEEFNGMIRGIQIYSGLLSVADIQAEIASPMSTTAGRNAIWYLNVNPRPSDVADKKGTGTPHNPSWDGTTAFEWTGSGGSSPPPPSAPIISGVNASNVTTSGAVIGWATNVAANSQVDYGTTTAYGQSTPLYGASVTSHSVSLAGLLAAATTYHYRVRSSDASGNTATSGDFAFTTASAGNTDSTPPTISGIAATNVTTSSARIVWSTNEPADSVVDYGSTAQYGQTTPVDSARVTSHAVNLASLAQNTTYHYRVRSKDAAGNSGASADFSFTTAGGPPPPSGGPPRASFGFNEATGTTTADASGNGFSGTLANGAHWASGHNGSAIEFDGSNDKVTLPTNLDVAALPFTLEAWLQPTSRADWRGVFSKRDAYSSAQMRFDVGLEISSGRVYVTTYTSRVTFTYAPPLSAWTHIAVVAESGSTKLYVDGVLRETRGGVVLGTKSTAAVAIGNTGDNDDPFAGKIDDLRLYPRALSAAEVQADMSSAVQ